MHTRVRHTTNDECRMTTAYTYVYVDAGVAIARVEGPRMEYRTYRRNVYLGIAASSVATWE